MKGSGKLSLSLAAPCLVLIAMIAFFHRKDNDKVQALPAFFTGLGVICSSAIGRNLRRKRLLNEVLQRKNNLN
ncbi:MULTISPECIES: DUF3188 domain-containing protein [Prochlorococcus]|uniref:Predicted membrane protein n=1 Tax=Prochlorococcus marinus (strain SARG / CCMP1375 / SS120) TaxID=167539 RepID=Q7V9Q7_PROMA|nr:MULTISPECIES: DUF3188 domain-containing protein [Prochlorococcus]AAQ00816.1 Predicted membrane protein [Prochlorococcus marinus subsp. marinus str. CCMP1375]KGG10689.1 hypothetical protein EV04_1649 [Prochlorococcus marinus str. LG]KGG21110.1 hypothetical protein EV08_0826 [Prochlorococcus marinus str. SS2]KGG23935.1 hypothetical protein EV09_0539 [Prochlorococcus marinus str. SS35]KGG31805.1 hypothetical protein EV10_1903 [Prochlorococcus marinus str. SS51]